MIREVLNMSGDILTIEAVLEEAGLAEKYEARGEAIGEEKARSEIARNLLSLGWTIEQTARTSRLSVEKVRALSAAMHAGD
jgi:predicted transposase YdaD